MMNDFIIKIEKSTRMVDLPKTTIGNDFENLQEKLIFKFTDNFVDGTGRLEYKISNNKYYSLLTKENDTYTIPVQNVITKEGRIEMQLVITEGTNEEDIPVFKSNTFYLYCNKSINAVNEAPESYDLWIEQANAKLNAMDEALLEVNNLDIDANKVNHTATIEITKKDGTIKEVEILDGIDGTDGQDGQDGYSPSASVTQTNTGATITITDKNGTTTADIVSGIPEYEILMYLDNPFSIPWEFTIPAGRANQIYADLMARNSFENIVARIEDFESYGTLPVIVGYSAIDGGFLLEAKQDDIYYRTIIQEDMQEDVILKTYFNVYGINIFGNKVENNIEIDSNSLLNMLHNIFPSISQNDYFKAFQLSVNGYVGNVIYKVQSTYIECIAYMNDGIYTGNIYFDENTTSILTKTGIPKSNLASEVQASLNKADSAIQDISMKQDITDNTLNTNNKTVPSAINEVNSIAKGANQALSYSNYQAMITAFNSLANNVYNVGQNVMIITLEVPDLWISGIESTSSTYTYTSDSAFTAELSTNGYVQVGYYKVSALETQKVDLTNYVQFNDYPSNSKAGVIKISSTYATVIDSQSKIMAQSKSYQDYLSGSRAIFISKGTLENVFTGKGFITSHQDITGKEDTSNKVTSLSSNSTDTQYPSAKCVYDLVGNISTVLASLVTVGGGN